VPSNKQRRDAARRKLERQLQARHERARRRRRANLITSIVGAIVVVGAIVAIVVLNTGDDNKPVATDSSSASDSPATESSSAASAADPYPCKFAKSGTAAKANTPPTNLEPPKTGTVAVAVKTNRGNMTFTLNRAGGPCAVESTLSLITQKYYDNTSCHRLVTSGIFVLQCGDPTGKGTGGPGYTVNDEYTGKETYGAGVIAMANTGAADSTGGQFFIMYKDSTASLGKTYTVIGKVTSGLDVVTKEAAAGVGTGGSSTTDGPPKLPITITSMTAGK
jgi:peptidyl-prolyl cis-trans isomerase B (cyclophilin B)